MKSNADFTDSSHLCCHLWAIVFQAKTDRQLSKEHDRRAQA